jgi:hypothetical protein
MRPVRALLYGTAAVAVLEAVETSAFWWLYRRVTPWQIFRYIASGLHGPPALEGGSSSTWLGIAIHFFNAFVIVGVYFLASRPFPTLVRHPVAWGLGVRRRRPSRHGLRRRAAVGGTQRRIVLRVSPRPQPR